MFFKEWMLQLFADGAAGDGGEAGAQGASETGVDAAAAGQKRLRELGVPESKIRNRASRAVGQMAARPAEQAAAAVEEPKEITEETTNPEETAKPEEKKLSFKELLAQNPEYNEAVQSIIRERLKGQKDARDALGKLAPALEVLARQYKMDPENLDYEAFSNAVENDDQYFETMALANGTDVDTARRQDQEQRKQAREQRNLEEQRMMEHFQRLQQQGEAMKAVFPGFDLRTELQNPAFARMTHPNVGISVEDAYYAVHRNEIQQAAMQVTAQKTAQMISNSIAAGQTRPAEAGQSSQASSVTTFDYKHASQQQRAELRARIRAAAARGEKIYPGQ